MSYVNLLVNLYSREFVTRSDLSCSCSTQLCNFDKNIQLLPIPTRCDMLVLLSYPIRQRKGGVLMYEVLLSIIAAVVGGVICHYIIKWLDSGKHDN